MIGKRTVGWTFMSTGPIPIPREIGLPQGALRELQVGVETATWWT